MERSCREIASKCSVFFFYSIFMPTPWHVTFSVASMFPRNIERTFRDRKSVTGFASLLSFPVGSNTIEQPTFKPPTILQFPIFRWFKYTTTTRLCIASTLQLYLLITFLVLFCKEQRRFQIWKFVPYRGILICGTNTFVTCRVSLILLNCVVFVKYTYSWA